MAMTYKKQTNQNEQHQSILSDIADLMSHAGIEQLEDDNEGAQKVYRMSHVGGLKAIKTVLTNIKKKVTTTKVLMFRHCCGLDARKENQAQKETPIIYF